MSSIYVDDLTHQHHQDLLSPGGQTTPRSKPLLEDVSVCLLLIGTTAINKKARCNVIIIIAWGTLRVISLPFVNVYNLKAPSRTFSCVPVACVSERVQRRQNGTSPRKIRENSVQKCAPFPTESCIHAVVPESGENDHRQ